jgi:hypothetical protein
MRFGVDFFVYEWIKYDLGDAFPVAKINEYDTAVIPAPMNPAHQNNFLVDVIYTKLPAVMGSAHVTKLIGQYILLSDGSVNNL